MCTDAKSAAGVLLQRLRRDWVLGFAERKEGEGLWLIYPFPQLARLVYYSDCLLVLEAGVLECIGRRKVGELCDPLGMG